MNVEAAQLIRSIGMDDIEGYYPLHFMNTPAPLQTLASAETALTLCRNKYFTSSCANVHLFLEKKFSCEEILDFRVPCRIRAEIEENIDNIREELKNWVDFHLIRNRGLFDGYRHQVFSKCFEHIVVDFSGCIDFKTTAMNILNSASRFSDAEKYKLACLYCLEDQVRRFWPSVSKDSRIDVNCNPNKLNLYFWNKRMESGKDLTDDSELAKKRIKLALKRRRGKIARAEFGDPFESLPVHERRVPQPILFLWYPNGRAAIRSLPLNREQVDELFEQDAAAVFEILLRNDSHFQYAHRMWVLMKSLILENTSRLESLLHTLLMMVFHSEYKGDLSYTRCDQINDLLLRIWSDTPNELKAHVADVFMRRRRIFFLERTADGIRYDHSHYARDMTILVELLAYIEYKQEVWEVNWRDLAFRTKALDFDQLMRVCLPKADEIEIFKDRFRNFNDLFRSLIRVAFYSDLFDYLMFCSNDAKQFQQLAEKVLESNMDVIVMQNDGKFTKYNWFLNEVCSKLFGIGNHAGEFLERAWDLQIEKTMELRRKYNSQTMA